MTALEITTDIDHDPYARFSDVPRFEVTSAVTAHGKPLADAQYAEWLGGSDVSPDLAWTGAPEATLSYAVTCWDPDAPTSVGYWHWAVCNIPATVTGLAEGAGSLGSESLPEGAVTLRNESCAIAFEGAGPPPGTGVHRYIFTVHALDVEHLDVAADASLAVLGFQLNAHSLGRGLLTAVAAFAVAPGNRG